MNNKIVYENYIACEKIYVKKNFFFTSYRDMPTYSSILNVTTYLKDNFPSLQNSARRLYVLSGDDPVGKPSTKGLDFVGSNWLIRSLI